MKIQNYKLFIESLQDDFTSTVRKYDSGGEFNLGREAESFLTILPEDLKGEFMYRVSDGEDITELIGEFLEKSEINSPKKLHFWTLIKLDKEKSLDKKFNREILQPGMDIITLTTEVGVDVTIKEMIKNLDEDISLETIIELLEETKSFLEGELSIEEWFSKKTKSFDGFEDILKERIKFATLLIEKLREQEGHELY